MNKKIKDLPQSVRVNSDELHTLQEKGWTTQKILDWAMKRIKKSAAKPEEKK